MKVDLRTGAPLAGVLIAFLALGVAYLLLVPLWETPDEPSTVSTALVVKASRRVPTPLNEPLFPGVTLNAKLYPPLYFALMGTVLSVLPEVRPEVRANPFGRITAEVPRYLHEGGVPADRFPGADVLRILRGISLLFGLVTLVLAWKTIVLLTGSVVAALLGVATFGLAPTFVFSHAAVDPLPLAIMIASFAISQMVRVASGHARGDMRALGIALGLGLVTRATLAFLYLPAGYLVWRQKERRATLAGQLLLPGLLCLAWVFVLAPGPSIQAFRHLGALLVRVQPPLLSFAGLRTLVLHTKNSFWARFGWADLYAPSRLIDVLDVLSVLMVLGWFIALARRRTCALVPFVAAVALLGLVGYVRANLAQFDPQGRYLGVLIAAYAPLGGFGLATVVELSTSRAVRSAAVAAVIAAMIAVNAYALVRVISPAYAQRLYPGLGVDAYQDQGELVWGGPSAGQTFIARKPGLSRIELYFTPARHRPRRTLEFMLKESPLINEPLVVARVPYPAPGESPYVGFSFLPRWDSQNRSYYVRVSLVPEGEPVSAWFALEDRYVGGSRYADDAPEPGDLRFTTFYALATPNDSTLMQ